jgi:glucosamine-phosphate N-acetyltransferase
MNQPITAVSPHAPSSTLASNGLLVRPFELTDFERGFAETLGGLAEVNLALDDATEIYRARCARGIRTYVVESEGRVIATASLFCEPKFIHAGGWVGHVEDVAVHTSTRRQGVGRLLVQHLVAEATRFGCYKVVLNCFADLLPFYEQSGFHQHDVCLRHDIS